jgi:hypothetical protein
LRHHTLRNFDILYLFDFTHLPSLPIQLVDRNKPSLEWTLIAFIHDRKQYWYSMFEMIQIVNANFVTPQSYTILKRSGIKPKFAFWHVTRTVFVTCYDESVFMQPCETQGEWPPVAIITSYERAL